MAEEVPAPAPATIPLEDFSAFWGGGEHYDQETGDVALSLAEQLGRTAWLMERMTSANGEASLMRVMAHLETLLGFVVDSRKPTPTKHTLKVV